jgi:hypothetical protein
MKGHFFSPEYRERISWILALGVSVGMIVAAFFLQGGDDLYRYYIPFVNGCLKCGYVPFYAQWFLWPLNLLPEYPYAWPIWTIVSVFGFMGLAYLTGINPFLFMVSFPFLGQIWLGQVDFLICLGLVIYLFARNPFTRGAGVILALIKPQLTAFPVLMILLLENPKSWGKLLVIPTLGFLTSVIVFGIAWPKEWIINATTELPVHVWRLSSMDVWKFGAALTPLPFLVKDRKRRLEIGLLVSSLATPFFGVYSYVTFLLLNSKWWTLVLSYVWVIGYYWYGESAMRFAWILPLFMLAVLMYEVWVLPRKVIEREGDTAP